MSVSRDDTIIAIRSAFLKKNNQQKFSLLTLIVISIIILVLNSFNFKIINYIEITAKEIIYRSSSIVSAPERYISKLFDLADEHLKIYSKEKKYENLEKRYEVEKLFNEGHISGAMLLSNSEIDSLSNEILKYKEKTVLVYCESGLSSGSFVKKLEEKGFGRVKYIKGGLVSGRQ